MKKKTAVALCVVLAVLLAGGAVAWSFLPHPLNYRIGAIAPAGNRLRVTEKTEDSVTVQTAKTGDFKILLFTDMHLDGKNETSFSTVSHLVENIQREKPDLVLLGGDNVTSGVNGVRCRQLARIFEKLDVYWAGVLGNHEGDNPWSVSRKKMMEIFTSYDHCLMCTGPADVTGDCNYTLHILNADGAMLQTFFFLDTFDMMPDADKPQFGLAGTEKVTDGARADQVGWYTEKAQTVKEKYGEYRSVLLQHIPLPQVAEAADRGDFLFGDQREKVCCSGFDSGLFDAVKASGTTTAVFCGHDHLNNFAAEYDGILLSYIEPSGYGSYSMRTKFNAPESEWLQGYTVLTLQPDGSFTQRQVRNYEIGE